MGRIILSFSYGSIFALPSPAPPPPPLINDIGTLLKPLPSSNHGSQSYNIVYNHFYPVFPSRLAHKKHKFELNCILRYDTKILTVSHRYKAVSWLNAYMVIDSSYKYTVYIYNFETWNLLPPTGLPLHVLTPFLFSFLLLFFATAWVVSWKWILCKYLNFFLCDINLFFLQKPRCNNEVQEIKFFRPKVKCVSRLLV